MQSKNSRYGTRSLKIALVVVLGIVTGIASFNAGFGEESPNSVIPLADAAKAQPIEPLTLEEARRHGKILHTAITSTLRLVHDRYYRVDQGLPIPAAVLKDVFTELEEEHHVQLRWLAIEGQAMNIDHKPQTSFENKAVVALKSGKREYEQVEEGIYRRAGAVTLSNHCLKCHVPDRKNTRDRTAGLIISIPVRQE